MMVLLSSIGSGGAGATLSGMGGSMVKRTMLVRTDGSTDLKLLSGGPDGYGYIYLSTQDGDTGVAFNYVDVTSTGVFIDADDDWCSGSNSATLFYLGFSFPFYGQLIDSVSICSNGGILLEGTGSLLSFANDSLPYGRPSDKFGAVLVMWDDLYPPYYSTGGIYFQSFTSCPDGYADACAVIQYYNVPLRGFYSIPMDFEIILYDNGNIKLQYNSYIYYDNATIGIQDSTASTGENPDWYLQYVYDAVPSSHVPDSGTAVLFVYSVRTGTSEATLEADPLRVVGRTVYAREGTVYDVSGRLLSTFRGLYVFSSPGIFFVLSEGKYYRLIVR